PSRKIEGAGRASEAGRHRWSSRGATTCAAARSAETGGARAADAAASAAEAGAGAEIRSCADEGLDETGVHTARAPGGSGRRRADGAGILGTDRGAQRARPGGRDREASELEGLHGLRDVAGRRDTERVPRPGGQVPDAA